MSDQTPESTPENESNLDEANIEINLDDGSEQDDSTQEQEGAEGSEETPDEPNYEEKFKASSKEAQRLVGENKDLKKINDENMAKLKELEAEKVKLEATLKDENPEKYDAVKTKDELNSIKKDLVEQKEMNEINDFVIEVPEAKDHRSTLRKLGRSYPNQSYQEIWDSVVKPLMDAGAKLSGTSKTQKKESQPETGKGSKDQSPDDFNLEAFNKLPLAKRKAYFKKMKIGDLRL